MATVAKALQQHRYMTPALISFVTALRAALAAQRAEQTGGAAFRETLRAVSGALSGEAGYTQSSASGQAQDAARRETARAPLGSAFVPDGWMEQAGRAGGAGRAGNYLVLAGSAMTPAAAFAGTPAVRTDPIRAREPGGAGRASPAALPPDPLTRSPFWAFSLPRASAAAKRRAGWQADAGGGSGAQGRWGRPARADAPPDGVTAKLAGRSARKAPDGAGWAGQSMQAAPPPQIPQAAYAAIQAARTTPAAYAAAPLTRSPFWAVSLPRASAAAKRRAGWQPDAGGESGAQGRWGRPARADAPPDGVTAELAGRSARKAPRGAGWAGQIVQAAPPPQIPHAAVPSAYAAVPAAQAAQSTPSAYAAVPAAQAAQATPAAQAAQTTPSAYAAVPAAYAAAQAVPSPAQDLRISSEDVRRLKDAAATDYQLRYTQLTPRLTATFGDIRETADAGKILAFIESALEESLRSSLLTGVSA